MTDGMEDWEQKYWARKQQQLQNKQNNPDAFTRMPPAKPEDLPHYNPADVASQAAQKAAQGQNTQNGWRDIDPMTAMFANQNALNTRNSGPQSRMVMVQEGVVGYKKLNAENFGHTMPLVKTCGALTGIAGKEFELKDECNCYLVDDVQTVDLSNIDNNKVMKLVEVRAPFIGSILVDPRCIVEASNNGKQILND